MRRHRAVLTIAAILLFASATTTSADGPWQVNAGVTRSTLFTASGWSGGLGYRFGTAFEIPLSAGVRFEPEAALSRRTTVASSMLNAHSLESRIELQYLEFPMLVKAALSRRWRWAPIVLGGAYYAVNLSARVHTEFAGSGFDENARSEVKRTDMGWVAGLGVQFQAARRSWTVEARYLAGLPNIYTGDGLSRWRTRSVTTTVGMKW